MTSHTQRVGPVVLVVTSLIGSAISLYNYLAPMTGVTGTSGALVVVVSSIILVACGFILLKSRAGGLASTVRIVALLGALGTLAAAWFLHEYWLMTAMALALIGVVIDFLAVKGGRK